MRADLQPLAKQSTHLTKYRSNYVFSDTEWINEHKKKLHKNDYDEETELYSFTRDLEIDKLLNASLKRDYTIFNQSNGNYRRHLAESIGYFEVFKIKGFEYFIEHENDEDGCLRLSIYNFDYNIKLLNYLSDLKQNYKFEIELNLESQFLNDKPKEVDKLKIKNIAAYIQNLFYYSIQYHHKPFFESKHTNRETLNTLLTLWSWKHYQDDLIRENRNGIISEFQELFLNISPYEFMLIRDYTISSINKYMLQSSKLGFQWGHNPYMKDIDSLTKAIRKNHSNKKIKLKSRLNENLEKQSLAENKKNPLTLKLEKSKGIKYLFKNNELYQKAINILIDKKYINKSNGKLNWIFVETKEYKTKQTIIALCVVLEIKQYLINSPKAIYNFIENDFDIRIDKATYSRSASGFKDDYEKTKTKNYSYTSLFRDIL